MPNISDHFNFNPNQHIEPQVPVEPKKKDEQQENPALEKFRTDLGLDNAKANRR